MIMTMKRYQTIIITLIFITFTGFSFFSYLDGTLDSDLNYHILSSEKFGIPGDLVKHGLKPFYKGEDAGWDGQFYYYMANDIFATKDTAAHIDVPSYRYQRIGLSLYTAIVAKIAGQDWVSLTLYFFSYLALIIAATVVGAGLLATRGLLPDAGVTGRWRRALVVFMLIGFGVSTDYNMDVRILVHAAGYDEFTRMSTVTQEKGPACFGDYRSTVAVRGVTLHTKRGLARLLGVGTPYMVIDARLTNTSPYPFLSTHGVGSVNMSYHVQDADGKVVGDGIRSAITPVLLPGESRDIQVVVTIPRGRGPYRVRLSPVQEECAWYYQADPARNPQDVEIRVGG